jgi:O-acetyl-ADP-ribose deacetylase (regulator of RNase III)
MELETVQDVFSRIEIIRGDITRQPVDAIVNAANNSLLGGGGVDGAIHRAAGPELLEECRKLTGCASGAAKITRGYRLQAKWVIHTVGPIWRGGEHREAEILADCYRNSLQIAQQHFAATVAFPSISTGAYGFPIDLACRIALHQIKVFLDQNVLPGKVLIVCFDQETYDHYFQAHAEMRASAI